MSYADDGVCHNAERAWLGQECGKPAIWIGTTDSGHRAGFCNECKERGYEAPGFGKWRRVAPPHLRISSA